MNGEAVSAGGERQKGQLELEGAAAAAAATDGLRGSEIEADTWRRRREADTWR